MPNPESGTSRVVPRLVVANWKMNLTVAGAEALARAVADEPAGRAGIEVLIAPAFVHLVPVGRVLRDSGLGLAAQDLHTEDGGAWTGGVSGAMLADLGVSHVLVGHSERRRGGGDSDDVVARKVAAARRSGLAPLLCVGEDEVQRTSGRTIDVVASQVASSGIGAGGAAAVVAYEPIWAIGTGRTATPEQVLEVHEALRARLPPGSRVLYGGSLTPQSAPGLLAHEAVSGFLVGGASLSAGTFLAILRQVRDAA